MKASVYPGCLQRRPFYAGFAALLGLSVLATPNAFGQADEASPFQVVATLGPNQGATVLSLKFQVPERHHLYADRIAVELDGVPQPLTLPQGRRVTDKFSQAERTVFEKDFELSCALPGGRSASAVVAVTFQGCSEAECYFPETRRWTLRPDNSLATVEDAAAGAPPPPAGGDWLRGFRVADRASGYLNQEKFLRFLDLSHRAEPGPGHEPARLVAFGGFATLGLILLGGLALNLTPCMLPMIPVNLAILGAGARSQDRRRGFLLGLSYGGGMAAVYGGLGLAVVLTGSKFGALNASPWFNFGIAAIFIVLGLAMFDKLAIDLSRFQPAGGRKSSARGAFLAAGAMGSVSALLAGACVAPVVLSVLLLAATLYQRGSVLALSLPFVLGLGMALPWPFAAAGLSCLPRPGAWMNWVKSVFGIIILGFAAWYGWLGWNLSNFGSRPGMLVAARDRDFQELRSALDASRASGRPVLVDFWASWCKNCEAMEHTTFRDSEVRRRLAREVHLVKFQAERLSDAAVKPVLDQFGVLGLPTYVLVVPVANPASRATPSATANH
jgi:thioredoxin:protein disulfide reductase